MADLGEKQGDPMSKSLQRRGASLVTQRIDIQKKHPFLPWIITIYASASPAFFRQQWGFPNSNIIMRIRTRDRKGFEFKSVGVEDWLWD